MANIKENGHLFDVNSCEAQQRLATLYKKYQIFEWMCPSVCVSVLNGTITLQNK